MRVCPPGERATSLHEAVRADETDPREGLDEVHRVGAGPPKGMPPAMSARSQCDMRREMVTLSNKGG